MHGFSKAPFFSGKILIFNFHVLIIFSIISESRAKYNEGEVNIHYKTPIRREEKEFIPEDELRKRQEDQVSDCTMKGVNK